MAAVMIGITAMAWSVSAEREVRTRFPEEGRFFPSRWYVLAKLLSTQQSLELTHVILGGVSRL